MFRLFSALILLCIAQLSFAATDLLNLANLGEVHQAMQKELSQAWLNKLE